MPQKYIITTTVSVQNDVNTASQIKYGNHVTDQDYNDHGM